MEQFYYLSDGKIKNLSLKKVKLAVCVLASFLALSLFINLFSIIPVLFPNSELSYLQIENKALNDRFNFLSSDYRELNIKVSELVSTNNELRLAANLDPLEDNLGVGGSIFNEAAFSSSSGFNNILSQINDYVEEIGYKINYEIQNHKEIQSAFSNNNKLFDAIPAIRPARGGFGDRFGMRTHPILKLKRMHSGLDILANTGEPVYATGNGKIYFSGTKGGMGKMIIIDHGFGYRSVYGHLSKASVKKGKTVKRGDLIGYSGNSGLSTGPHLHYEVRHKGIALNPRNFIFDDVSIFEVTEQ